jgi:hypothetical protein
VILETDGSFTVLPRGDGPATSALHDVERYRVARSGPARS